MATRRMYLIAVVTTILATSSVVAQTFDRMKVYYYNCATFSNTTVYPGNTGSATHDSPCKEVMFTIYKGGSGSTTFELIEPNGTTHSIDKDWTSYSWTITNPGLGQYWARCAGGTWARINIQDSGCCATCGSPCNLNITYPSGGESFCPGQTVNLTWSGTSTPGCPDVIVELYNGTTLAQLFNIQPNNGSYSCTLSSTLQAGSSYRFRITCYDCTDVCWDWSNGFSVLAPVAPNSASATPNPACPGQSVTLSASGGAGGTYTWYKGGCGSGSPIGSGSSIQISAPSSTTTYYVRTEGSCGSSGCASLTLSVNSAPAAPSSASASPNSACSGQSVTLSASGGSGGTFTWYAGGCGSGSYIGSGSSIQITAPSSTTTYYVRTEGTCGNSSCAQVSVNVTSSPVAPTSAVASPSSSCAGNAVTLTASGGSGGTYTWYAGGCGSGSYIGSGSSIQIAAPSSTTTYYVRTEGTCGNSSCAQVSVNVTSSPVAPTSAVASPSSTCAGNAVTLTASGGSGGTYTWYAGGCGSGSYIGSGSSIQIAAPSSTTTYYVRTEGTCGNSSCAQVSVNITSSPVAPTSAVASPSSTCAGNAVTLTASGGSGGTYTWYAGGCGSGSYIGSGSSIQIAAPSSTTTYFVRTEGACGNSSCAQVTLSVNPAPTAPSSVAASPNPACAGQIVTLTASGGSNGTYTWYVGGCGNGSFIGTGASLPITAPSSATTYYVRMEGSCGNSTCASVSVNIASSATPPSGVAASPNPACPGQTVTLTASGGSGGTLKWYVGACGSGASIGSGSSIQITAPSSATTYSVRTEGSCGNSICTSVTLNIASLATPPSGVTASPSPACPGQAVTLTASGGSGGTYTWYAGGCGSGSPIGTGASLPITAPSSATTYYVRMEGSCGNSTCASVSLNVASSPTPPSSATASPNPACAGQAVTLTASGGSNGTYTWYASACGSGSPIGSGSSIQVTAPSSATTYYVRMEGSCGNSTCASVTLSIASSATPPSGITASPNPACPGQAVTLTASGGSGGTYMWYASSCGSGSSIGTGASLPITAPSSATTYYVRMEGSCGNSTCASVTLNIASSATPPSGATASPNPACPGQAVTLTASGGSGGTYTWYAGGCGSDSPIGTGASLPITAPSSATTYYVRMEGSCGNSTCASVSLSVASSATPPSGVTASPNPACPGQTVTLTASGGSNGTYTWYAGGCGSGSPIGSGSSLQITAPSSATTYYVRMEGSCGSSTCASITLSVSSSAAPPSGAIASPNPACPGQAVTLTASGGSGGTYTWYAGSCGSGSPVGSGLSIQITAPSSATTYYVRMEGTCGNSSCASVTLNVASSATPPSSATASPNPATPGTIVTLTASGGSGGNYAWYAGDCGSSSSIGSASSIQITAPSSATTYYVRMEGSCGSSTCASVSLNIQLVAGRGACCVNGDTCLKNVTNDLCAEQSGTWQGETSTNCANCSTTGACHLSTTNCRLLTETNCVGLGGEYDGDGSTCPSGTPIGSVQPNGLCGVCGAGGAGMSPLMLIGWFATKVTVGRRKKCAALSR